MNGITPGELTPERRSDICGKIINPSDNRATYSIGSSAFPGIVVATRTESGIDFLYLYRNVDVGRVDRASFSWIRESNRVSAVESNLEEAGVEPHRLADQIIASLSRAKRIAEYTPEEFARLEEPIESPDLLDFDRLKVSPLLKSLEKRGLGDPSEEAAIQPTADQASEVHQILSQLTLSVSQGRMKPVIWLPTVDVSSTDGSIDGVDVSIVARLWGEDLMLRIMENYEQSEGQPSALAVSGMDQLTLVDEKSGNSMKADRSEDGWYIFKVTSDGDFTFSL